MNLQDARCNDKNTILLSNLYSKNICNYGRGPRFRHPCRAVSGSHANDALVQCRTQITDRNRNRNWKLYRGADKSLARPASRCILSDCENISFDASLVIYTGLFKMTVGVVTTCHTQYTWDRSLCIFLFNRTTLQVLVTYLTGATSRTVPGSIPGGVTGFFSDTFPSDRTMALVSTQPLVKMSTRNIPGGKGGRCVRLTTYHHAVPLSRNLGALTS